MTDALAPGVLQADVLTPPALPADALTPAALPADALSLDPLVVGVILAMAAATYATKASGLWLVGHVDLSDRLEAGLDVLPGAVVVAFVAPALANGGVPEWTAAAATAAVARKTGNLLASLVVGVAVVLAVRSVV